MLAWFIDNLATILVGLALTAVIVVIIIVMVRNKKKGKSTCGCSCSGCAMAGSCHDANDKQTTKNSDKK